MQILAPKAEIISIGQDRYIFMSSGKQEYEWFCENISKRFNSRCMTRAKLYFFIDNNTDISYLKTFFMLSIRNMKLTKGKKRGIKINIIAPTAIKKDLRELLYQYKGMYHLDGTDYMLFSIPDKGGRMFGVYNIGVHFKFDTGFYVDINNHVKHTKTRINIQDFDLRYT